MNKKSMAKIGGISVFVVVILFFIFLGVIPFLSSNQLKEVYLLGDEIVISVPSGFDGKIRINFPSESYIFENQKKIKFVAEEVGHYEVYFGDETYFFDVVSRIENLNVADKSIVEEESADFAGGSESFLEAREGIEENLDRGNKEILDIGNFPGKIKSKIEGHIKNRGELKVIWKEQNQEINFEVVDSDSDGYLDEVYWDAVLPGQTYEVIIITKAEHLDSGRNFLEDVYSNVSSIDGNYATVLEGEYLRVQFERNLTSVNDITIYAKGNGSVEVYEKDRDVKIADFGKIGEEKEYKIFLNDLIGEKDVFDLKVIGGSVLFDYVVDPIEDLYVDSYSGTYTAWTVVGTSPYLGNNDDYIYGKSSGIQEGNFGFENSAVGDGKINSVTLYLEASADDAPSNDGFYVYVSDGGAFTNEGLIQPASTSYALETLSLTTKLDTWTKINAAQIYVVYYQLGGVDEVYIRRAYLHVDHEDPDLTAPNVSLLSPIRSYNSSSVSVNFNCSSSDFGDGLKNSTLYGNWTTGWYANETKSITGSYNYTEFTKTISDGYYVWNCYVCDNHNNCAFNSTNRTFSVDTLAPRLNITNPSNNSNYTTNNFSVNYTVSDPHLSSCWYSNDTDTLNKSLAGCINISGLVWKEGARNVTLWVNDTLGHLNSSKVFFNVDTLAPSAVLDTPTSNKIINETPYLLNATSSSDSGFGLKNASWYWINSSGSGLIGSDTVPAGGLTYGWSIGILDGVYNISVEVYDNFGNFASQKAQNVTIDVTNTNPTCSIVYPNGGEGLKGGVTVQATASELDPSDYIKNLTFYYSSNDGVDWSLIGSNTTSGLSSYTYSWNTAGDVDSNLYLVKCNVSDSHSGYGSDESNDNLTVDNTIPTISAPYINTTDEVLVNNEICLNVTVSDNLIGVDKVIGEIDCPSCGLVNISLYDSGGACDSVPGDGVYSTSLLILYTGEYNWTYLYANDSLGNMNKSFAGLNWTGYSLSYLISEILDPISSFLINESGFNTNFTMECNTTCNDSGWDCNDVFASVEYEVSPGVWIDIATGTTDLVNDEDNYDCGDMAPGDSCIHVFNVTSGSNSGGNTWELRCHGESTNAAADFSDDLISVHVNNFPVGIFTYPTESDWLHGTEILDVGDSTDSDGNIVFYSFEIDDNSDFSNPSEICSGASSTCSLNTYTQTKCLNESTLCFIRINVTDDNSTSNSTFIQVGIDNLGASVVLDWPQNDSFINLESFGVNATPSDFGSGVSCVVFEYYDGSWNSIGVDCSDPYEINWDLSGIDDQENLEVRVRANDSEGNFGEYDTHVNITHDVTAPKIYLYNPYPDEFFATSTINFNFSSSDEVADNFNCSLVLDGSYNVSNSTTFNETFTIFSVEGIDVGIHSWNVNCTDWAGNENSSEVINFSIDLFAPNWSEQNQTVNSVFSYSFYKGDTINLSSFWEDDFNLSYAVLSTNESSIWSNQTSYDSPEIFYETSGLSSFGWNNASVGAGEIVGWRIYANDSTGNFNVTNILAFRMWGWSKIASEVLQPSGIEEGGTTQMRCYTLDNETLEGISGYTVSFYNGSILLGTNTTDSNGLAVYTFSISAAGNYLITCNITNATGLYYNASSDNNGQVTLGVGYGLGIYDYTNTTHKAYEGTNVNVTTNYPFPGIDDPYSDLESPDDNIYQTYTSPGGSYAYTRFEFLLRETENEITKMNFTWEGKGSVGSGTQGYILYLYNVTSGSWIQKISHSGDSSEHREYFWDTDYFNDFINSSGWVKVLARSYSAAPSGGTPTSQWASIDTDYIKLEVEYDIVPPKINLTSPVDYYNSSTGSFYMNCSVYDDQNVENVSLYGSWKSGWHLNDTNSSGFNDVNYSFYKTIGPDASYVWGCYACDEAGNCNFAKNNRTFIVDTTSPSVFLVYPQNNGNFSEYYVPYFNFSVNETHIDRCILYGNWTTGWHGNKTYFSPPNGTATNFSGGSVNGDDFYVWNVWCNDTFGHSSFNSTNRTFAAFLFPGWVDSGTFNATQTESDGTGNVVISWDAPSHVYKYFIYAGDDIGSLSYLDETLDPNYTDTTFAGERRRFYRVDAVNPTGQNSSVDYFGAHVYTLKHNVNTKNWISFPTNITYLDDANHSLAEITNATSFTMWNSTIQQRVTCNDYSCPTYPACTLSCCNFALEHGQAYEVNINSSAPSEVNWSAVGIVYGPNTINLVKNATSFGKNWVSLYADTVLTSARNLTESVPNCDAVSRWDESSQTSQGLVYIPLWGIYVGTDFQLNLETGYEVSVTSSSGWNPE